MAGNPNPSQLDQQQIIQRAFQEVDDRLRVDAAISIDTATLDVVIDQADDSIKIGDGVNLITSTQIGPKSGLDVNIINTVSTNNLNSLVPFPFDSIYPSYPDAVTELYVYKQSGSTVATVTVIYTDGTKNNLVSIVRT